jgi:phosphatidylglycerophosphate synthase
LFDQIRQTYRASRKQKDIFWNIYVARPIAAAVLQVVPRGVTPNQVTFAALGAAALAGVTLALWRTWTGLVVGAVLLEASYVLDCVDGQLARLRGQTTPVGAHLDFLMDELKAFLYVSAIALRLWLSTDRALYLIVGLLGLAAVAGAISLTTFMRRPEYLATGGAPAAPGAAPAGGGSPVAQAVRLVEAGGRWIVHYPSYFLYLALLNFVEGYFFVYLAAHVLYLGRALLQIVMRLARPGATPKAAAPPEERVS